ncbi:hypothetical protein [Pseudoalteromonas sp. P1-16-1b]|uniref:hypothetical protein n=1 Tax=Pseudoalteromonas sp. P1-16-1b TaxID=1723757 RepID=UPI0006D6568B|nr:hypothetical protein [Pseudoalteromonas sp. P1-16-1b]
MLDKSNELRLSYLIANKLNDNPKFINRDTSYKGILFRILIFIRKLIANFSFNKNKYKCENFEVYIYSGTKNQYDSLVSTAQGLYYSNVKFKWTQDNFFQSSQCFSGNTEALNISFKVLFSAIIIFLIKAPRLYFRLLKLGKRDEIKYGFDDFCMNYIYIPYFIDELKRFNYKLVIMSNDHNQANRCLNLVSKENGIETCYLQHASVSHMFPKLEFNYAFLDGYQAFENYLSCEDNVTILPVNKTMDSCRTVFLSGQKKVIGKKLKNSTTNFNFGIAVNKLDCIEEVIFCVNMLLSTGLKVSLRVHPAQNKAFLRELDKFLNECKHPNLIIMSARDVSLSSFFSFVDVLFASNSSIHLEAALAGVITIYINFGDYSINDDYYGYVAKGVSFEYKRGMDMNLLESLFSLSSSPARKQAIQKFSATYSTCWNGNEGQLVAETIREIIKGDTLYEHFENTNKGYNNFDVYSPKAK